MSFGKVIGVRNSWHIECEPQVRARLKRVFPRLPQSAGSQLILRATPENTRELHWFLMRYPMEIAPEHEQVMERLADQHLESERQLADLLTGRLEIPPFELAKPPRGYQREGAHAATIRGGILLADDLGLGKTVTAMCLMAVPENLPAVVVYPAALPNHWPEKLAEFAPQLRVHHVRTGKPYPLLKGQGKRLPDLWDTPPDVILVSYHKLRGWAETLAGIARYVVFEECQQLRNSSSEIYRACLHLSAAARLRMGLTATPIYNYGSEFWNVIEPLLPGALGGYMEFQREWCIAAPGGKAKLQDPEVFGAYLRREGIMLRRTRKEVGRELPALTKVVHEIEADRSALELIGSDAEALAKIIVAHNEQYRGQKMQAAGEFDQLVRQATGVAKAHYVAEFVRMLVQSGQRVLLFGWHRDVYGIWLERLADLNPRLYTGSESPRQKADAKAAFIAGESQVLVMSLRAAVGLDGLQDVCSTAVFGELDWSPGVHEQCIGRIHRDGQQDPVMAFYLVSDYGSDPIVADVNGVKREQIEGVRNPDEGLIERIDIGQHQLRRLAEEFLAGRGIAVPPPEVPSIAPRAREPEPA